MGGFGDIERGLGLTGRYSVEGVLAEGGMGTVYRATQLSLDRSVALKVLKRNSAWQAEAERRFLAEAHLAARISHPNVVRVLEPGSGPHGLYIAYELVDGKSLRAAMGRPMTPVRTLQLMQQAASALGAVHEAGAVHRDVKPENMLLDAQGILKLTDLGIAKDLSQGIQTQVGLMFGTPAYMSPEQCASLPVTAASDLYSLGVVIYELLAGGLPFDRATPIELLEAHLHEEAAPPSERNPRLPATWDKPLLRALQKNPAHRFSSAREMGDALEQLLPEAERLAANRPRRASTAGASGRNSSAATLASARPSRAGEATRAVARPLATRAPRRFAALALGVAIAAAIALSYSSFRSEPAPPPAVRPTPSVTVSPPEPPAPPLGAPRDELAADVWAALRAETTLTARLEKRPGQLSTEPGFEPLFSRLLVVDVNSIKRPVLRVRIPEIPASAARQAPRLAVETAPGSPVLVVRPVAASSGSAWVAELAPGTLQDGTNRVRLEVPQAMLERRLDLRLEFERTGKFPSFEASDPRTVCPTCCPDRKLIDDQWDKYNAGRLLRVRRESNRLQKQYPRCGEFLVTGAYAEFRIAMENRAAGDWGFSLGMAVLDQEVESLPTIWKVKDSAASKLDQAIRLYPGWLEPWHRYAMAANDAEDFELAQRAARLSVLLDPQSSSTWTELADATRGLSMGRTGLKALPGHSGEAALALKQIERALALMGDQAANYIRGNHILARLLAANGKRTKARAVFEHLTVLVPGMRQAKEGLDALRDSPPK